MSENFWSIWLHLLAFTFIMSLSVYLILDLEMPHTGLITMQASDQLLLNLLASVRKAEDIPSEDLRGRDRSDSRSSLANQDIAGRSAHDIRQ